MLGEGAFGTVYRARDPQLDRDVAIKVPRFPGQQSIEDRERFLREARAAAGLHHAHICPVHEVGTIDGRDYIVQSFIDGKPLSKILQAQPKLTDRQIAAVIRKLALALQEAHDQGIIHRDLKPTNIMINRKGEPVIMDFGLARRTHSGDAQISQSGQIMGTPAYMSPEQARGDGKAVGPATDIYSLGIVLYELICGRRPFEGTVTEVIGQILHVDPPLPIQFQSDVDERLQSICLKAISKNAADRFESMKAFAVALAEYARSLPSGSRPATAPALKTGGEPPTNHFADLLAAISSDVESKVERAVRRVDRSSRWPWWSYLAGYGVMGVILLLGIFFFIKKDTITVIVNLPIENINDPTLLFLLDGQKIDPKAFAAPIELKAGQHELTVNKNGELFKRFQFNVDVGASKDGVVVDDVTERAAAKELLSLGASVHLKGVEEPFFQSLKPLPAGSFHIIRVAMFDVKGVPLRAFEVLGGLTELSSLCMHRCGLPAESLNRVVACPQLEAIDLADCQLKDGDLAKLLDQHRMTSVSLHGNPIGRLTVNRLAANPHLHTLNLNGTGLKDDDLSLLCEKLDLKEVHLNGNALTEKGLKTLESESSLKSLYLEADGNISKTSLERFQRTRPDCQLVPNPTAATAGGWIDLFNGHDFAGWKNSGETMVLRGWVISEGAIVRNKSNPYDVEGGAWQKNNLWTQSQFGDFILEFEFRGKGTNTLVIRADQPDDRFADHGLHVPLNLLGTPGNAWQTGTFYPFQTPQKAPKLTDDWNRFRLTAIGPKITAELNGETINEINLDRWAADQPGKVDPGMLTILKDLSPKGHLGFNSREGEIAIRKIRLQELGTEPAAQVDNPDRKAAEQLLSLGRGFVKVNGHDRQIRQISDLPTEPFRLTGVYFADVKALDDNALAVLKDCVHLTELDLRSTRVTEKGLGIFRGRTNFTSLGLAYLRVTDASLEIFQGNKGLKSLFLHDTLITDNGLRLFHDCHDLETIWVGGTPITDAGMLSLRECKFLRWLDVRATKVNRDGVQTMKAALPACRIDADPNKR